MPATQDLLRRDSEGGAGLLVADRGASAQLQRRIRTNGEDRHCALSGRRGETQALGAVSATWAT
jgi:hypothetical protein